MPVKIASLDYRATQDLLNTQTTQINAFLIDKTVTKLVVVDEFIMAHYTNAPLIGPPLKVKIFNLIDSIRTNGIAATETAVNNFINTNVTTLAQDPIALDSGVIVLVYR